jgi:hypothetical protein
MSTLRPLDSESVDEKEDTVDSVKEGGLETLTVSLALVIRHMICTVKL